MKLTKFRFVLPLLSLLLAFVAPRAHANGKIKEDFIQSVLRRKTDVFAVTLSGIYHADLADKTWKKFSLPPQMPNYGGFVQGAPNSSVIYYYAKKIFTIKRPGIFSPPDDADENKIKGLYASHDDGRTWHLNSRIDNFDLIFLHPDGSLFAATSNSKGKTTLNVSKDEGQSWRDITGNDMGMIGGIFADPDHPHLACVRVFGIRPYIYQASDERYVWTENTEWDWWAKHKTPDHFFDRFGHHYGSMFVDYTISPTLSNYFAHDFGDALFLPGFDVVPAARVYSFGLHQAKQIPVTVSFLLDPASVKTFQSIPHGREKGSIHPPGVVLADQTEKDDLWGLAVQRPDGKQQYVSSHVSQAVVSAHDRHKTLQKIRATGQFHLQDVSKTRTYRRKIDLDRLYHFSTPGTYRVQLVYDSKWFTEYPRRDAWTGTFRSSVFSVTIR